MRSKSIPYKFVPLPKGLLYWHRLKGAAAPAQALVLYCYLADHVGANGYASPSFDRMEFELGIRRELLTKTLKWLQDNEELLKQLSKEEVD